MKKLEIIIRPERLDDLKNILNSNGAHGLMITNIMGYGSQKGHKQVYNGFYLGGPRRPPGPGAYPQTPVRRNRPGAVKTSPYKAAVSVGL